MGKGDGAQLCLLLDMPLCVGVGSGRTPFCDRSGAGKDAGSSPHDHRLCTDERLMFRNKAIDLIRS